MSDWSTWLPIFLGGIATLAIYSFLIQENSFYRFFEHLYIGIATGFGLVFSVQRLIWPQLLRPMLGEDRNMFANGEFDRPWRSWYLLYLLPAAFGTLYYFIYSRKRQWLSRVVIAWSLGVSGGFALKGFFAEYMPQIIQSFKPLVVVDTVDRKMLVRFEGVEERLPADAEISAGRIELYNLGPYYARFQIKAADQTLSEVKGKVTRVDAASGEITVLDSAGTVKKFKQADVLLVEDLRAPANESDAYEGYGGAHQYKAFPLQRPWSPSQTAWHQRLLLDAPAVSALATALKTQDALQRVAAVESALGRKLSPSELGTVQALKPDDVSGQAALAELTRWRVEDVAPVAESNAGVELVVRNDVVVRDVYRQQKWESAKREATGAKIVELSKDTLNAWFNRPETNFGIALQWASGVGGSLLHRFASSSHEDQGLRPRLVIEYKRPGDEKPQQLVLQQGLNNYSGTTETLLVEDQRSASTPATEMALGETAHYPDGKLSVNWWGRSGTIANWIFMFTLICVMAYFLFSFEHAKPGIRQASQSGRWLMMVCFGAFFGSTIMARMALLVERLNFLIGQWIPQLKDALLWPFYG